MSAKLIDGDGGSDKVQHDGELSPFFLDLSPAKPILPTANPILASIFPLVVLSIDPLWTEALQQTQVHDLPRTSSSSLLRLVEARGGTDSDSSSRQARPSAQRGLRGVSDEGQLSLSFRPDEKLSMRRFLTSLSLSILFLLHHRTAHKHRFRIFRTQEDPFQPSSSTTRRINPDL